MSNANDDECVSKKPWSEVLSRTAKIAFFNFGKEGGRSFGKIILYVVGALLVLMLATWAIGSISGWFGAPFEFIGGAWDYLPDWIPGADDSNAPKEAAVVTPEASGEKEPGAICSRWTKWNPFCN